MGCFTLTGKGSRSSELKKARKDLMHLQSQTKKESRFTQTGRNRPASLPLQVFPQLRAQQVVQHAVQLLLLQCLLLGFRSQSTWPLPQQSLRHGIIEHLVCRARCVSAPRYLSNRSEVLVAVLLHQAPCFHGKGLRNQAPTTCSATPMWPSFVKGKPHPHT